MAKWVRKNTPDPTDELCREFGLPQAILKVIINRGFRSYDAIRNYLEASLHNVSDGSELTDMEKGTNIILQAVREKKKIRVIGDYDVDGVTSTYILYKTLSRIGADCDHFIPHRVEDGYGLHEKAVQDAYNAGVEVILTCDNGISAMEPIRYAKTLGMTVVVTDHHEIPFEIAGGEKRFLLPPADAVIDPKRDNVFHDICGAVVAWKFAGHLGDVSDLLEFAALGTVCDVMPLIYENRAIVKEGLKRCSKTNNTGLQALLEVLGLSEKPLKSYDFGFIVGPCINAEGRLNTAEDAFQLFCERDHSRALEMAAKMKEMNAERQELTKKGMEEAFGIIDREMPNDKVLVVYLQECHESIAGIIAGRIREKYGKPSFVLTDGKNCLKGSGRSIEKYSMYEELVKCQSLLLGFGGHPMAAGLSLLKENLDLFRETLNSNCVLTESDFVPKRVIDAVLPVDYLTEEFIKNLSVLEPFGKGNEKPIFAQRHVMAYSADIIGKNKNVLKVKLNSRTCRDAVCFQNIEEKEEIIKDKLHDFDMLYYPTLNIWNGRTSIQADIIDVR